METTHHPDDERLAAFADGEPADGELTAHVAACAPCGRMVADLRVLRASLAELPDLVPSRPLRFVPPVAPEPVATGGFGHVVRRLFAPAMVAGAALVLVGSVGMAATPGGLPGMSGGAALEGADNGVGGAPAVASAGGGEGEVSTLTASPAAEGVANPGAQSQGPGTAAASDAAGRGASTGDGEETEQLTGSSPVLPWTAMTIAGAILLILTLVLRWTVVPRAPHPPAYPGA